jgi:DNA helicase-2/ATP-dependent DNA helicase PcrA
MNTNFVLSPQQQAVIDWVVNDTGSLELVARAGAGKSSTLLEVVKAVRNHSLGQVALMAYNKSIADELKTKLTNISIDWKQAQAGTCHSFGFSAWKKISPAVRVESTKVRDIINGKIETPDEKTVWNLCGSPIAKLVSLAKQRALGHLHEIDDTTQWFDIFEHFGVDEDITDDTFTSAEIIAASIRVYRESLDMCRDVIDFDDMILAPLYFKARFWQFDWVLVDEAQDTNPARRALALAITKPRTGRVIFVGDPMQNLYAWTGADSDAMTQMKTALNAKTLNLSITYRCPKAVVKLAQTLVPDLTAHESAPEGKVSSIVYAALADQGLNADDAILCRNTAPLISTAYSLISKGIACRVAGKDIAAGLIKLARRWKVKSLVQLEGKLDDYVARESAKLMSKDKQVKIQLLEDNVECLRVMIDRCRSLNKHTVSDLIGEIEGMFGDDREIQNKRLLTLMTAHRSKGLEFKRVFILGRDKFMPSSYAKKDWEKHGEVCCEYVAITRAKEELVDVVMPSKAK